MIFQELFSLGMKRDIPSILRPPINGMPILELGPGLNPMPECIGLEYPEWNAERDRIPYHSESVAGIYAFHFFEHLSGATCIKLLREIEAVLVPGGVLTVVVPYFRSEMAHHDLDHKSFWTLETWRNLFDDSMYKKNKEKTWRFRIHFNVIAGIAERNLAIFTQLVKI